jgi:hypothetical protein
MGHLSDPAYTSNTSEYSYTYKKVVEASAQVPYRKRNRDDGMSVAQLKTVKFKPEQGPRRSR